jgi:DNA-binding transcriptional MerR regulator
MTSRTYLSIGDVLTLLRREFPDVTISKIRFLESQGLVNPERTPSGYRKFYESDVERLRWVLRQQREHFLPLKVIKGRLEQEDEFDDDFDGDVEADVETDVVTDIDDGYGAWSDDGLDAHEPALVGQRAAGAELSASAHLSSGSGPGSGPALPGFETISPIATETDHRSGLGRGDATEGSNLTGPDSGASPARRSAAMTTSATAKGPSPTMAGSVVGSAPRADGAPGPIATEHTGAATHAEATAHAGPAGPGDRGQRASGAGQKGRGESPARAAGPGDDAEAGSAPPAGSRAAPSSSGAASGTKRARNATSSPTSRSTEGGRRPAAGSHEEVSSAANAMAGTSMTLEELAAASGMGVADVTQLESFGLISGRLVGGVAYYDEDALMVARMAAGFAVFGVEARHLRLHKNAADREAGFIEQIVLPLLKQRNPEARQRAYDTVEELTRLGLGLRTTLLRSALRNQLGG